MSVLLLCDINREISAEKERYLHGVKGDNGRQQATNIPCCRLHVGLQLETT
ncbi:hypothetical protein LOC67_18730 [Stieleria sp. JC731]|uniref:hypothetical protein n=1 Tax=Pirellulaceae TaxID=2691357 RepID=UPI001E38BA66|nr:hypothetical protein [Stieleria sp. JC731]MCC9602591.1 hypothetical protein [Stieleria sp. JC731]